MKLARHALGLPNEKKRGQYNRILTNHHIQGYSDWCSMNKTGLVKCLEVSPQFNGFWVALTRAGAEAALFPGETLDPEDFPG